MTQWSSRAVIAVAAVLLLAGCGSYTKRSFIASANAICAATVRDTRDLTPPVSSSMSDLAAYLAKLTPILHSEERQIAALQRPTESPADRAKLMTYLAALRQSAGDFDALEAAARAGDRQALTSAEASLRVDPVTSAAAAYGLRSCAAAGSTVA